MTPRRGVVVRMGQELDSCFGFPDQFCKWDGCPDFGRCLEAEAKREGLNRTATLMKVEAENDRPVKRLGFKIGKS